MEKRRTEARARILITLSTGTVIHPSGFVKDKFSTFRLLINAASLYALRGLT
jgi:hypothetical protein